MKTVCFPRLARLGISCLAVLFAVGLLSGLYPLLPARAQTSAITMTVKAGFDGKYKTALWVPTRITLANDGPDVSGIIKIAAPRYTGETVDYQRPIELPSGSRKEVYMYVSLEGFNSKLTVDLVSGRDLLASQAVRLTQLSDSDLLYGVWASSPSAFNILAQVDPVNGQGQVAQLELADLPPASTAWRALDLLIISDVDTGQLSEEQQTAMRAWVAGGGRLIVTGGPNWQKAASGLSDLLPFRPAGSQTVTGLEPLMAYAGQALPAEATLVTTGALQPGAVALVSATSSAPLVVEKTSGYGRVNFLTFDPNLEPFKVDKTFWSGMEGVYRNMLSLTSERPSWAGAYRSWYNASQAVSAIPGVGLPNPLQICIFLGGYVFVVGPLNYLILLRFKRRELAWITTPLIVVLFTLITYAASFGLRGAQPTLHRLTLAQAWEDSDRAQVETLVGIFSPRRSEYDLQVTGDRLLRPLPTDNNYYGGVDTSLDGALIEQGDTNVIRNIRVDVGAVKSFIAQGQAPAPKFTSALKYTVGGYPSMIEGAVTNLSDLTLRKAVVLGFGGSQQLGDLAPGATAKVRILLGADRATVILPSQTQILPPGAAPPSFVSTSPSYYSGQSNMVDEILGGAAYYDNPEEFRRYQMLMWLLDPYGRGSGTYLVGWTDQSPIEISLANGSFNTSDQTLYMIRLQPQVEVSAATNEVSVPPGLMTWQVLDPGLSGGDVTPYDLYLTQGEFSIRFKPFIPLSFERVASLTLHANSFSQVSGDPFPTGLIVSLRDQTTGEWVELPGVRWQDNQIEEPERFVGGDGHIDLKVENTNFQNTMPIDRLDFTLIVE